ncbi:MAG TPA: hypothetical protein VI895_10595 [Bdellovibrionota bacterium]|nr:hypothetical protein [Bdellovibrionota bacterium]
MKELIISIKSPGQALKDFRSALKRARAEKLVPKAVKIKEEVMSGRKARRPVVEQG